MTVAVRQILRRKTLQTDRVVEGANLQGWPSTFTAFYISQLQSACRLARRKSIGHAAFHDGSSRQDNLATLSFFLELPPSSKKGRRRVAFFFMVVYLS